MVAPGTRIIRNERRKYLNPSRNIGAELATREYLLFIDDDNVLQEETIQLLVKTLQSSMTAGVVAPVALTPEGSVWYAGGRISEISGFSVFDLRGAPSSRLPERLLQTELFHNCFMMRSDLFRRIKGFDGERFPMYLAEADASERIRRLGLKVIVNPAAVVVHEIEAGGLRDLMRNIHITDAARAYFVGRNRILFMRMHRGAFKFVLFLIFFQPMIAAIHILSMVAGSRTLRPANFVGPYLRGVVDGVSGRARMGVRYVGQA